jgi:hypothetical protein
MNNPKTFGLEARLGRRVPSPATACSAHNENGVFQ